MGRRLIELVALTEIQSSTGTIQPGSHFRVELDRARDLINHGDAKEPTGWDRISWRGETVVILASGPSLNEADCEAVRAWRGPGRRAIAINTTFRRAPWADVLFACDGRWWRAKNPDGETYYEEVRRTCSSQLWTQERDVRLDGVNWIESVLAPGLNKRHGVINQGGNGGYMAINLAYHAGVSQMILLGFDMSGGHWHGAHPSPLTNPPESTFNTWIGSFNRLASDLRLAGVKVVNCSRETKLKCFPIARLEDELET